MAFKGFILQSTYRVVNGKPIILIYGRLEDGRTFLVRETRRRPTFYVRSADVEQLSWENAAVETTSWNTLDGLNASRVTVTEPSKVVPLRDRIHGAGIRSYEADIPFATAYLMERDIRGGVSISGNPIPSETRVDIEFTDPSLEPSDVDFIPRCLSLDIETDPDATQLLAISLYSDGVDEVHVCDPIGREMPTNAIGHATEQDTIEAFVDRVRELDPDVLTGWNVVDFDLDALRRISLRTGAFLELGRAPGRMVLREAQGYFGSGRALIPGRVVLDGIDLVRGAFIRFPEYSLEVVAQEVLGEGKQVEGDVHDRAGEILERYEHDLSGFASYARTDARLAYQIIERLKLLPLAKVRSTLTGMPMDRVAASVASFDFVYIAALKKRRVCAPSFDRSRNDTSESHAGGAVLSPEVGIHSNVWVLDYKSLYPSIIRTFNVDPLGYVGTNETLGGIRLLNDAVFSRNPAILPGVLDGLYAAREQAKQHDDSVASQAIKILMNSFYGVLATPVCRFHNSKIGNAITTMGRHFLMWSKDWFESRGFVVLYGDTDSVFVASGSEDMATATMLGKELTREFNAELADYIQRDWQVESKLELEFEKLYSRLFLLPLKKGSGGARKRYAGQISTTGEVEFVGMEVVRRDWTELAKDAQRELYARLFNGDPVEDFILESVNAVRAGRMDEKLVYRKGLGKPPTSYTKVKPPHVVAALKSANPSRVVHYVMTVDGPEPTDNIRHEIDREHYVETQLKAVAEPVLATLGTTWESACGIPVQRSLFDALE
ncbi:MAG: DNA polymerase II [Gammaproteobacteria bacterium]|nr:DNA polymerase II [Gammaproteobacteria bacterium]